MRSSTRHASAGVGRFVLFSTDKAVQPTSVLGQTKAVAEWIVAAAGAKPRTGDTRRSGSETSSTRREASCRSSGDQVARGGPVTVTHPEATRYLMTAGEAAGLAIVAGALADSSSVFWLDSGPPVRVLDLAQRLASAPSHDVGIDFVGLRAGERLHERLFSNGDEIAATPCEQRLAIGDARGRSPRG